MPVLEVGGTHVTAAVVDLDGHRVVVDPVRRDLDADGAADALLDAMADAGRAVAGPGGRWGVAMPSPFEYDTGVGRFHGVGKFGALDGVDVRAGLTSRLGAASVAFGNDADAFGVGEWLAGAAQGLARVVCLTLGTGVGSAWLADGVPLDGGPLVPPEGRVHLLHVDGAPLEDTVSRRALRRAYRAATGDDVDVAEVAERARAGEEAAAGVLAEAFGALGRVLAPWVSGFGADVVVVGGSVARSWDLVEPPLARGLASGGHVAEVRPAATGDEAGLLGAAWFAARAAAADRG